MALKTYSKVIGLVFMHEGGYTNHPADPGGPTNWGVTIHDAARYAAEAGWIAGREVTIPDMKIMPRWFAEWVFKRKYWDAMRLDDFEPGVDYALFDLGINSGLGRSCKTLRRVLGLDDSVFAFDDGLVEAANAAAAARMVRDVDAERLRFLKSLRTWSVFGGGWGRRVAEVNDFALSIAEDLPIVGSPSVQPAQGFAIDPDEADRARALQRLLVPPPGLYAGAIDGDVGPQTVKAFQRAVGLDVDGVVGAKTGPLLEKALQSGKLPKAKAQIDG